MKKAVLAFSGGLDTSFCAVYLAQELGYEVISVTVDTGGFSDKELKRIEKRARELGVSEHHTVDGKSFVYERFISYIIKANALRGNIYPLSVGAERVAQAIEIARVARAQHADVLAHGSTGAGNDQIRFDVAFSVLMPDTEIVTPIRSLGWSRDREAEWLRERGFEVPAEVKEYSINEGLWGTTIGGKETHDPWDFPPESVFRNTKRVEDAPVKPEILTIDYVAGLPVTLNGERLSGIELIGKLSSKAGLHGIGRGVHIGDTILGIKGRIVFEAAGPLIVIAAHRELEKLTLSKKQRFWKDHLGQVYGDMLHEGLFFDPVMRDIEAMIDSSQECVSGSAKIRMHKGNFLVTGVKSEHSLMKSDLATYGEVQNLWDSRDAEGFSRIYAVPAKLYGIVNRKNWME